MKQWFMLTVIGSDQAGIVSGLTGALYQAGANLGEASMARLGGNFTIMLENLWNRLACLQFDQFIQLNELPLQIFCHRSPDGAFTRAHKTYQSDTSFYSGLLSFPKIIHYFRPPFSLLFQIIF